MSENDPAPLLRLPRPRTLARRRRKLTFPPPPQRVPVRHAGQLGAGVDLVRQHLEAAAGQCPQLATAVPYVRIEPAPGALVTDQEVRSLGLIPVYRREDAVLAAYSPERNLRRLDSQIDSYAHQRKKLAALAKIETIQPWTRADRTSQRLQEAGELEPTMQYIVDVLLLPVEGCSANPDAIPAIERYVDAHEGRVVDRAITPAFTALRVQLGGQALDDLLEYRDDVALVDLPPAAHVLVPEVMSLNLDSLPEVPPPAADAPAICIVDSGILEGHPLLEPAVLGTKSRSFPASLGPPVPRPPVGLARHGTQVAGIAAYSDLGAAAIAKAFLPAHWLVNARFLDDNAKLSPERMPFLRDIVEHARDRCRVFNLSFGLEPSERFLSVHAVELDTLTREFGVLFVAAAGNRHPREHVRGTRVGDQYPEFLLGPGCRVLAPAEALNVLTVGGITPDRDAYPARGGDVVAPKRAPSPFTRSGGLKNVVKPELVEVAGNLVYDETMKQWFDNSPGLRVPTTSDGDAKGRLLGWAYGTSFAAPRVAHMAARIIDRHPDATVNLVRALLVQSARRPDGVAGLDPVRTIKLCGFGVPDLDRALYCRPERATLYYEGEIQVDEVKLFEVPVPPEFANAKGTKAITVTLAYDPPVSVVHRDRPAGVVLTWGLARGDRTEKEVEREITAEAQQDAEDQEESGAASGSRTARAVFMTPGKSKGIPKRLQRRGTVQKNIFAWKRGTYGDTYRLAITAKATRPAHAKDRQRFAVVVTLECENDSINVYAAVRTRVSAGRVRVRVPAT